MPTGLILNSLAIVIGGIIGTFAGQKLSADFKEKMNMIFGSCAMAMGISSIVLMKNMPAVIFSVVFGTALGLLLHFEGLISRMGVLLQSVIGKILPAAKNTASALSEKEYSEQLLTVIVLFCASGTGIYGSIVSGMNGDHSILISKAILDLPTSLIFAAALGITVSLIAIPQFLICFLLFLCGGLIFPLTTPAMIDDFKAVGGVLLLATGFRIIRVKMFPTADMIPAMILAMPVSWLWTNAILPLL